MNERWPFCNFWTRFVQIVKRHTQKFTFVASIPVWCRQADMVDILTGGDCELIEFADTVSLGGNSVPTKTTRQQCEDHCLFYVRELKID